ncbi:MAG: acyl-CoA dehydrogenase [Rhodospirillaceae bacterium TMED8]|nr:acyl-CoA dehydrogenase [Magnetovibrio sp.]OUT49907.1 MAG: acyl-CoA dehydrogenase [Rhodospirillaceae bacterium TMED8]
MDGAYSSNDIVIENLLGKCGAALRETENLLTAAHQKLGKRVFRDGCVNSDLLEANQFAAHGYAWLATYVEGLRQMLKWARRIESKGKLSELEILITQAAFGEYLNQMISGIAMSQVEVVRARDIGLTDHDLQKFYSDAVTSLIQNGNTNAVRMRIADLMKYGNYGEIGLGDETLELIRDQFRRFVDKEVMPNAHKWHLNDDLIPMDIIKKMAELGVFGLTVPEQWGGLGLGKISMCLVTEELSRGYIGVGSLSTRSEIAAELIRLGGTDAQKNFYLPKIASGEILPAAVFTEPNTGSDLANLQTRAEKYGAFYRITGNKTWITHAARTDIMTLLARTDGDQLGYKGLSMFLAEKPRSADPETPFPAPGMFGGEIEVLGYRGMKEYEISFDNFEVPASQLLGSAEGQGFKQLMATFESARIQTAARAVGVGQNALELGVNYAQQRIQFTKPIAAFPRVAGKLAWMAVELMVSRQLTHYAARQKDLDCRCDIEAGMAKLLAARVAWANADNALQIHGGNGYALEYPISRVLCDARILNIFEGAAEIQSHVIARGLLDRNSQ